MSAERHPVTAFDLDAMSRDQRTATVGAHIVTDLGELPDALRERVLATGRRLAAERARAARE